LPKADKVCRNIVVVERGSEAVLFSEESKRSELTAICNNKLLGAVIQILS
jgi:hypothetical protein